MSVSIVRKHQVMRIDAYAWAAQRTHLQEPESTTAPPAIGPAVIPTVYDIITIAR